MSSSFKTISHIDEFGHQTKIIQENCATSDYNRFIIISDDGSVSRLFCMTDDLLNKLDDLINTKNCVDSSKSDIDVLRSLYS